MNKKGFTVIEVLSAVTIVAILILLAGIGITRYRADAEYKDLLQLHSDIETSYNNYRTDKEKEGEKAEKEVILKKNSENAYDKYFNALSYQGEKLSKKQLDGTTVILTKRGELVKNNEYMNKTSEEELIKDAVCVVDSEVVDGKIQKRCKQDENGIVPSENDLVCIKAKYNGGWIIDDFGKEGVSFNKLCKHLEETSIGKVTITPALTMSSYRYGDSNVPNPVVTGNPGNGNVKYYYTTSNTNVGGWIWEKDSTASSLSAGEYYMYAVVEATETYAGATTEPIKFTIEKSNANSSMSVRNVKVYAGSSENLSLYINGAEGKLTFEMVEDNTEGASSSITKDGTLKAGELSTTNDNDGTVTVKVTASGNNNYEKATKTMTITVEKYTREMGFRNSVPSSIKRGESAAVGVDITGSGGVAGRVSYTTSNPSVISLKGQTLKAEVSSGSSVITAKMARTSTVKENVITKTITAERADQDPEIKMNSYTYGGEKKEPSIEGNEENDTVVYYYNTTGDAAGGKLWQEVINSKTLDAGEYYIYATVGDKTTPAVKFTINKGTCSSPSNINVTPSGIITWTNSESASSYEISIAGSEYKTAVSGENHLEKLIENAGEKNISVRAVCDSKNYNTPSSVVTKQVKVYALHIRSEDASKGTVDIETYNVIEGATYSSDSNVLIIKDGENELKKITATPAEYYKFKSWSSASGTIDGAKTITASFVVEKEYTVKYNANGGTGDTLQDSIYYVGETKALSKNTYTKEHYNFIGWSTNENATEATYTDQEVVQNLSTTDGDIINLYAVWKEKNYVVNVVVLNGIIGGDGVASKLATINTPATFEITPSSGYTTEGVVPSCTNGQTATLEGTTLTTKTITDHTTCTVTLVPIKYTLTVNATNGMPTTQNKIVNHGSNTTFEVSPNANYGNGTVSCTNSQTATLEGTTLTTGEITNNTTCTVTYSPNIYKITLDNQDADSSGTGEIYEKYNTGYYLNSDGTEIMSTTNAITVPTKKGYIFEGYYTLTDGGGTQYIEADGKITTLADAKNFTSSEGKLYAKWIRNPICPDPDSQSQNSGYDVLMVLDISSSMSGERLNVAKQDIKNLVTDILSDSNNRAGLITFNSSATLVTGFTNDITTYVNNLNNVTASGTTSYEAAFQKVYSLLNQDSESSKRASVIVFLSDGVPVPSTADGVSEFNTIKTEYPNTYISAIQYDTSSSSVKDSLKKVSDKQYKANTDNLDDILPKAVIPEGC